MIEVIDNHSVRTDLLTRGRGVLDVGCRGFRFAHTMRDRGLKVIALDPDPEVQDPHIDSVDFMRVALVGWDEKIGGSLLLHPDPEARSVVGTQGHSPYPTVPVQCVSMDSLMKSLGVVQWDLVKLNCEGAEYEILQKWRGPIARQIVVSFHEHTPQRKGKAVIQQCMDRLAQWYKPIRHQEDARYGAGLNYWDTLLCLKEIA